MPGKPQAPDLPAPSLQRAGDVAGGRLFRARAAMDRTPRHRVSGSPTRRHARLPGIHRRARTLGTDHSGRLEGARPDRLVRWEGRRRSHSSERAVRRGWRGALRLPQIRRLPSRQRRGRRRALRAGDARGAGQRDPRCRGRRRCCVHGRRARAAHRRNPGRRAEATSQCLRRAAYRGAHHVPATRRAGALLRSVGRRAHAPRYPRGRQTLGRQRTHRAPHAPRRGRIRRDALFDPARRRPVCRRAGATRPLPRGGQLRRRAPDTRTHARSTPACRVAATDSGAYGAGLRCIHRGPLHGARGTQRGAEGSWPRGQPRRLRRPGAPRPRHAGLCPYQQRRHPRHQGHDRSVQHGAAAARRDRDGSRRATVARGHRVARVRHPGGRGLHRRDRPHFGQRARARRWQGRRSGNHGMKPVVLAKSVEVPVYGGKAAQLAAAIRAGLPVPGGVALSFGFVDAVVAGWPTAIRELTGVCATLDGPVAVRSSAVGEDSETASFAGQHLTCLNVRPSPPALADAVRAIWQSARAEAALAYRRRLGLSREPRMGVVVQELVDANCAGVLFTRNPFDGVDEIVIEASWGLGESIVAGLVTPDRFRLSHEGAVLERTLGTKDIAVRVLPEGGTYEAEVPAELVRALCLDDAWLRELHELAMRCEETFGGTQDLEWAFAGGTLYLLQRRAVTSAM